MYFLFISFYESQQQSNYSKVMSLKAVIIITAFNNIVEVLTAPIPIVLGHIKIKNFYISTRTK